MPGTADVFRELHRLRRHAKNLKDEIDRLPRMVKVQQGKVARQEALLKQAHDQVTKLKLSVRSKETTLKATHEQIVKYQKQLDTVASKKEMDALQVEIAHAKESCQKLEDEILTTIEDTDKEIARIPEIEKDVKQAKAELANSDQIQKDRQGSLMGELKKAQGEIKEVEVHLPEDVRQHYNRLVTAMGEDALSAVQGRTCVACYTEITAQMSNSLIVGSVVLCKSCGRMLYLGE